MGELSTGCRCWTCMWLAGIPIYRKLFHETRVGPSFYMPDADDSAGFVARLWERINDAAEDRCYHCGYDR